MHENISITNPIQDLKVHMICHTHNDVGWLKTIDLYYYGGKNYI